MMTEIFINNLICILSNGSVSALHLQCDNRAATEPLRSSKLSKEPDTPTIVINSAHSKPRNLGGHPQISELESLSQFTYTGYIFLSSCTQLSFT